MITVIVKTLYVKFVISTAFLWISENDYFYFRKFYTKAFIFKAFFWISGTVDLSRWVNIKQPSVCFYRLVYIESIPWSPRSMISNRL